MLVRKCPAKSLIPVPPVPTCFRHIGSSDTMSTLRLETFWVQSQVIPETMKVAPVSSLLGTQYSGFELGNFAANDFWA